MNLYFLGEEAPSISTLLLLGIISEIDKTVSFDIVEFNKSRFGNGSKWLTLKGISSDKYDNFYFAIASGSGSFCDLMVFEGTEEPEQGSRPMIAIEVTKSGGAESGNMTDQRACKFIPILEKWKNVACWYVISNPATVEQIRSSFKVSHICAFRTMATMGVKIFNFQYGTTSLDRHLITAYGNIDELVEQEGKKGRRRGTPSRVFKTNNGYTIQCNLFKKGGGPHDPGEGYVTSRSYVIGLFEPNVEIHLTETRRDISWFTKSSKKSKRPNKFLKAIGLRKVFVEGVQISDGTGVYDCGDYWSYCDSGEKIGSIVMELEFNNIGWRTLFSNHASCEKSYLLTEEGYVSVKNAGGIPDLVFTNDNGDVIIIEAETSENVKKGLKQARNPNFGRDICQLLGATNPKKYLCTYGHDTGHKNVLFHVNSDRSINYNNKAKVIP
jgi:hypothetical protein